MRIDAHQHYWDVAREAYGWDTAGLDILDRDYLPDELEPQLQDAGVDASVVVQVLHTDTETDWLLDLADAHASIAGVVGWVDLCGDPEAIETRLLALRQRRSFVGIRHLVHEEPDDTWLRREDVARGLAVLERLDVPFDLLFRPRHLPLAPYLSERFPDLRMVIDHIAKPQIDARAWEPWSTDLQVAAQNSNIYCKVSGMVTEANHRNWQAADLAPYVDRVLQLFGPDRSMFGSDWPVCTQAGTYQDVVDALRSVLGTQTAEADAALFGATAARFYGIAEQTLVSGTGAQTQDDAAVA